LGSILVRCGDISLFAHMKLVGAILSVVASVVAFDSSELSGAIFSSLDVKICGNVSDVAQVLHQDVDAFVVAIQQKDMQHGAKALEAIVRDIQNAMCKSSNQSKLYQGEGIVQSILDYLKNNFLHFDEAILEELGEMTKVCTFQAPDGKKCGQLLVQILKHLVLGNHHNKLELDFPKAPNPLSFFGGLMNGLLGDDANYKACAGNFGVAMDAVKHLVSHLKHRQLKAVLADLSAIFGYIWDAILHRHAQLKGGLSGLPHLPHLPHLPGWVPNSKSHACALVEETSGQKQIMVPGCVGTGCNANGVDVDCAWCVYDLDQCVASYQSSCHETVAARAAQNALCTGSMETTTGSTTGSMETTTGSMETTTGSIETTTGSMETTTMETTSTMFPFETTTFPNPTDETTVSPTETTSATTVSPSPDPSPSPSPRPSPSPSPSGEMEDGACMSALSDLKPLMSFLHGGNVLGNLKRNFLATDDEMLKYAGEMGKFCTFREPDGQKCGFRLGAITRDLLAGIESEVMV